MMSGAKDRLLIDRRQLLLGAAGAAVTWPLRPAWANGRRVLGPTVKTNIGKIRGLRVDGVHVFKGVPYAAAPIGEYRFQPPHPHAPWKGVRETIGYGLSCPQRRANPMTAPPTNPPELIQYLMGMGIENQGEDCLVLNIWTCGPHDRHKRPVMVWLHGGGFESGSGSSPQFDGTRLCRRGDVVVVTLNHRLNAFGFTHLADAGDERFAQSSNLGMRDIVAALEWIRANIEAFGGDPNNVTVFGQSGGARKASVLLAMPAARGLFHRAIVQSGPGIRMLERDTAQKATELLLTELNIPKSRVGRLLEVPTDALVQAYYKVNRVQRGTLVMPTPSFAPVVDGESLPRHPFDPTATSVSADVPVMTGSTRTELSLWSSGDDTRPMPEAELRDLARSLVGDAADSLVTKYHERFPDAPAQQLALQIQTDLYYGIPTKVLAARKAALGRAPVYVYRFDWATPVMGGKLQSPHGIELPFVFDNVAAIPELTGDAPEVTMLAEQVSSAWIAFARTGTPARAGLPAWSAYNITERPTMLFNTASKVENDPEGAVRPLVESALQLA